MESIGKTLKQARIRSGKSLDELHGQTRIITDHLKLMERGQLDFLPPTYVKSFLRAYSDALGLDAESLIGQYDEFLLEERRNKTEQRVVELEKAHSLLRQRVVLWGVGVGAFIVILGLIFAYLQYRAYLGVNTEAVSGQAYGTLADVSVEKVTYGSASLLLSIKAKAPISLDVQVDENPTSKYLLMPDENRIWTGVQGFDIAIYKSESDSFAADTSSQEMVKLTISNDSLQHAQH